MEIKELENLLSISRFNIRFYEKQGLLTPKRSENNYRSYSEQDVAMLKKIIVLRKMGFTVEEISAMQKGDLLLTDVIDDNIARLESEIKKLKGSLETAKELSRENTTFEDLDQERYWDTINESEKSGKEFIDICKDYLAFELANFDRMWKYVFFFDFKKARKKHGALIACGIILLICLLRGVRSVIKGESFWYSFSYPFIVFAGVSLLLLPIYILDKKAPKVAAVISTVALILIVLFLAFLILLILYAAIDSIFA